MIYLIAISEVGLKASKYKQHTSFINNQNVTGVFRL